MVDVRKDVVEYTGVCHSYCASLSWRRLVGKVAGKWTLIQWTNSLICRHLSLNRTLQFLNTWQDRLKYLDADFIYTEPVLSLRASILHSLIQRERIAGYLARVGMVAAIY